MASCLAIWPKSDYVSSNSVPGNVSKARGRITSWLVYSRHIMLIVPHAGGTLGGHGSESP